MTKDDNEKSKDSNDKTEDSNEKTEDRNEKIEDNNKSKKEDNKFFDRLLSFLPRLWSNWITLLGMVLTTVSGCTVILLLAAELFTPSLNAYASVIAFLIMPTIFLFGLLLIPIGLLWEKRRKRKHKDDPVKDLFQAAFSSIWKNKSARYRVMFFVVATFLNIFIFGMAGHHALVLMDSPEFCGKLCHSAMQPEYEAYIRSPHSRVKCVECHIGPGATWAVKAKVDGIRQVWALMVDSYARPIPSPVKELRPARETCEQCHWPAKLHSSRVSFYHHFGDDEKNTHEVTGLLLKVGGEDPRSGKYKGIHWHVSPDVEISYQALDDKREKIGKVVWKEKGEVVATYEIEGEKGQVKEQRIMDCVDCHNRPTHIYDHSAAQAVDRALAEGQLDANVPFQRKVAIAVLDRVDVDREKAEGVFAKMLSDRYAKDHPDIKIEKATREKTAEVLAKLYLENIFPDMKIGWDTYPSHLGHRGEEEDKRGCFRCHDDEHKTKDGKVLRMDCDLCHEILFEEEKPQELPEHFQSLLGFD